MAKDNAPDLFDDIEKRVIGDKPTKRHEVPRTEDEQSTDEPRDTHAGTTDDPQKRALEKHHIRFDPDTWAALRREARRRGLTASALVRMIVNEWLRS